MRRIGDRREVEEVKSKGQGARGDFQYYGAEAADVHQRNLAFCHT